VAEEEEGAAEVVMGEEVVRGQKVGGILQATQGGNLELEWA